MKIFVVTGTTGEYSDRVEWLVKAVKDEQAAKDFVVTATKIAREQEVLKSKSRDWLFQVKSELDPDISMEYTGTNYYYSEVELEE